MTTKTKRLLRKDFEMTDLGTFTFREWESKTVTPEHVGALSKACTLWTYYTDDGTVIGIVGLAIFPWRSAAELFLLPSDNVGRYALVFQRSAKDLLVDLLKIYKRVQTHSIDTPDSNRWMASIGFGLEAFLRKYGPDGLDYCLWSVINDE